MFKVVNLYNMLNQHHNFLLYSNLVAYLTADYPCDNFRAGPCGFKVCSTEPESSVRPSQGCDLQITRQADQW